MQVVVNDLLTSYSDTVAGDKTAVLLHGWADSEHSFTGIIEPLREKYRIVSLDLPGSGKTEPPTGVWGLDEFADFTRVFLEKIGVTEPYAIIGHSNGGAIAIHGIASGKLRANRLVLLASSGVRTRQKGRKLALKAVAKTGKAATIMLPGAIRQRLKNRLYKAAGSDMLVLPHLQETFKKVVNQDILEDARTLKLPTVLIYGAGDTSTPPEYGHRLRQAIMGSRLEIIPDAGHHIHQDQPEKTVFLIQEFLR